MSCGGEGTKSGNKKNDSENETLTAVTVENLQTRHFKVYLNYYSKLRGIKEATVGALIGGRIEKINFGVGESVKEKDVIVQFPLDAPASMYEQTKSAFENSEKNYERAKVLLESGETSQSTFDGLKTNYLVDKRNFETQKQMLFVEAPFDGVISEMKVKVGDNVQSKDPLFTVAQLSKMVTKIWATEYEIRNIKRGMRAEIESGNKKYFGRVIEVSLVADPNKQSFYEEIKFDN
jgi:RND family efflux transporter MFP subunit